MESESGLLNMLSLILNLITFLSHEGKKYGMLYLFRKLMTRAMQAHDIYINTYPKQTTQWP